ncbi:hypothetical protein GON01_08235 [Sphingomonas sp. MAH-20]|uniref:Uncharacterized protein n=1 Tax=Sphingomonas horti TaxID=2682842 RepID=A0A6I4J056_9SPHN|nr:MULTISPECIES: hypothetical protein [Sphingomonas]MBA2920040.1 hypothetical protein [Sphingomonas sp. CGMCC 1.13658]MVO77920.1 hypothetical protein [Sphingomonas horti]
MGIFGFATDLAVRQRRVSAPAAPAAAITSLEVLGAAVLPDGADAAIPNGWVAKATLPDDGVSAFDPKKISLTVTDPGFDTAGNATVVTRTITGTEIVRKQYPNQGQRLNSAPGGIGTPRTVYFALSEEVFAGSTITAANAAAGYYGGAAAGSIAGIVNSSSLAYPVPLFAWLQPQHERATGASFAVEAACYHRHAMNGQQVACIEFYGRDAAGGNLTAVQRASLPALSAFQTAGPIVEAWKATIPLATLPQGDLCQAIAVVKPWIGPAFDLSVAGTGVYGTLTAGTPVDTAQPETPLRFLCDKTGGYGGLQAWVKAGASGGAVGSSATPFATVQAALAALATANGSGKGHADHSGSTIFLMDNGGAAVDHAIGATSATAAGKCWTDIKVDPAATGQVRATVAGLVATADLLRFFVPFFVNATGNNTLDGGSSANVKRIAFEGAALSYGASLPAQGLTFRFGMGYWRNCTLTNAFTPFGTFSGHRNAAALVLGCTGNLVSTGAGATPYAFIGNAIDGLRIDDVAAADANAFPQDGMIIANNVLTRMAGVFKIATQRSIAGAARVQNVLETAAGYPAGGEAANIAAGGTAAVSNIVSMHNTVPGVGVGSSNQARQLGVYADTAGTVGVQRQMVERFELLHQRNCKVDTFTVNTTATGRTGPWRYRYGVGLLGNVVVTGDASSGLATVADPSGNNWSGEYLEPGSSWTAGEANVVFVDNKSGSAGAGGGNYALSGAANAAYGRVPAGQSALRYDLAGRARLNDGTGAAGAYERD